MNEILTGIHHWKALDPELGRTVHSFYISATRPALLIDPRRPRHGFEWFSARQEPKDILLTGAAHFGHAAEFAAVFGAEIWCHRAARAHVSHGGRVRFFEHGATLPGGVIALPAGPVGTAFYIEAEGGVIIAGDTPFKREPAAALLKGHPLRHVLRVGTTDAVRDVRIFH